MNKYRIPDIYRPFLRFLRTVAEGKISRGRTKKGQKKSQVPFPRPLYRILFAIDISSLFTKYHYFH